MAASWLLWFLAAAIFVSVVLLAAVCLNCRNKGPLVSIRQANASDEYMPSTQFRVIHPSQPTLNANFVHPSSNLLSPFSPSSDPGTQRRQRSFTPTETESNPSYENPVDGSDYINGDSDAEDPGYIIVLPEGEAPLPNHSRASTPCSDSCLSDYENVPKPMTESKASSENPTDDDRDYQNVDPQTNHSQRSTPDRSDQSDSDDNDLGNYVNVPETTEQLKCSSFHL